jgi:hypothetical protein
VSIAKNHAEVTGRAREALRRASREGALRARGTGMVRGVPVRWSRTFDGSGRVVEIVEGSLSHRAGFDGQAGWRVDEAGMPGRLDLRGLEGFLMEAAVWSGGWADAAGIVRAVGVITADSSRIDLELRLCDALPHQSSFRLTLDAGTALPRSVERLGCDDVVTSFEDFRPGGHGLVPHRVLRRHAWLADTLDVESIEDAQGPSYQLTEGAPADTTFDRADAIAAFRRTRNDLLLMRPRIGGRDVGWFLVDTGAGALAIDAHAAARLALPGLGRRMVRTADGVAGALYRRAEDLCVGGVTLRSPLLLEVDMSSFGRAGGVKLAGILGYDLFRRATVTLDVDEGVRIEPAPASLQGDEVELPLRFEEGVPVVAARYPARGGPREGLFALDTGSGAAITAVAGAAASLDLSGGARASLRGLGGPIDVRRRSIAWIELAHHRLEQIDVVVPTAGAGAVGDGDPGGILGYLGMGVLGGFTVTLDYSRERVRLRRKRRALRRAPAR